MKTIPLGLEQAADQHPELPALVSAGQTVSYDRYRRLVRQSAAALRRQGLKSGDRWGRVTANTLDDIIALVAVWHSRCVACPLSPRFPAPTVAALLAQVDAGRMVTAAAGAAGDYSGPTLNWTPLASLPPAPADLPALAAIDGDQEVTIIFTSGSSAAPKAVLHTWAHHCYNALGANANLSLQPGHRWLLSLPLYHVGGLAILFRCLLSGAAVVIPEPGERLAAAIERYQVTHVSLVATQLQRVLDDIGAQGPPSSLEHVLLGGSAIPPRLIVAARQRGLKLYTSYGLTEMGSQVTTTAADDGPEKLFTSGRVLAHREIKVAPDGEILVRGRTCFKGYVQKGGLSRPFDQDGWFPTADLGLMDAAGFLTVSGRKDNMFISGGENIQPEEIEVILARLENVEAVMVVPVSDAEYGQRPVAFVKLKDGRHPSKDMFADVLAAHLPRFKIPDRFYSWPEPAASAGLKPSRPHFIKLAAELQQRAPTPPPTAAQRAMVRD